MQALLVPATGKQASDLPEVQERSVGQTKEDAIMSEYRVVDVESQPRGRGWREMAEQIKALPNGKGLELPVVGEVLKFRNTAMSSLTRYGRFQSKTSRKGEMLAAV